jgi:hypothetical protein
MVEEMAEAAAETTVEESVEVLAVVSPGLELARAESAVGGGDAEALNKGWVACRASPLPSSSARVSESEGEEEEVTGVVEVGIWSMSSSRQRSTGGVVVTVDSVVEVCCGWSMTCVVKGSGVKEALLPCTSPCDWCVSSVEALDSGWVASRQGSDASDAAWGGEQEDGREWRRGRGLVAGLRVELWERTAKGLAVWGKGEGDGCRDVGWDGGRDLRPRVAFRFTLVDEEDDSWTGSVWISVSTRMVWRETSAETTFVGEEEEMEEDDADVREREWERGAASGAEEGDECDEVTWVGRDGGEVERGSAGSEGMVERGGGGKDGETSWREVWSTLLSDPTSQEWVRVGEKGKKEGGEWVKGGPACSRRVDSWLMT